MSASARPLTAVGSRQCTSSACRSHSWASASPSSSRSSSQTQRRWQQRGCLVAASSSGVRAAAAIPLLRRRRRLATNRWGDYQTSCASLHPRPPPPPPHSPSHAHTQVAVTVGEVMSSGELVTCTPETSIDEGAACGGSGRWAAAAAMAEAGRASALVPDKALD